MRAAIVASLLLSSAMIEARADPRVVSINLCTDQLVIALADPRQIAGLSPYARDRQRSWAASQALDFPSLSGAAEDVLAVGPDLVFAGRYTKLATRELLKQHGLRVIELAPARSIDEAKLQIRQVATLLGHPDRAERAVDRIQGALSRARSAVDGRTMSVLPLMRRGWVSGRETLIASLITSVGMRNAGDRLTRPAGGYVPLEALITAQAERLLISDEDRPAEDQGSALLHHSSLEKLFPSRNRIVLPERLTSCGGPMLAEAIDVLSAGMRR